MIDLTRSFGIAIAISLFLHCRPVLAAGDQPVTAGPLTVEPEDLQPGLVARYRSQLDRGATLARIEAKPAFCLGYSSPSPRIPPGSFEVVWTGALYLKDPAPITFDAYVCGEVVVEVDGVTTLKGSGRNETSRIGPQEPLERPPGVYRLKIVYHSLPNEPARLQIWWQCSAFSREPLPPWHLYHVKAEAPPDVAREQLADKGRVAVGKFGCSRCHSGSFPGVAEPPPGPSLADAGRRINRTWLLDWLDDPAKVRSEARMPALFAPGRTGLVERWVIADYLLGLSTAARPRGPESLGDHRLGRRAFVGLGCAACHYLPDAERAEQADLERVPLTGLNDRLPIEELASFLSNPRGRYPDGRMPQLPIPPDVARNIGAFLLMWSNPARADTQLALPPTSEEIGALARRLGARGLAPVALALIREKRCAACHVGLGDSIAADVPLRAVNGSSGCLSGKSLPKYALNPSTQSAIAAYQVGAAREKHASPFASRQRLLERLGCVRCHQRDSDRPPPIEAIGSTLGGAWMEALPFQRTPRLTYPHQKYARSHLLSAIREGVSGLRPARYTYRMPAFGQDANEIVQALAEADGELPAEPEPQQGHSTDPTLGPLAGPSLAGFQGYACVSCHMWNGQMLSEPDPGAVGTDLTRVTQRIRRDWFDRFLEAPARAHPGTPMPGIFIKGKPATLASVLDGDAGKQRDALWSYFALGKEAPNPKPPPPVAVTSPTAGEGPLIAQIPVRLADGGAVESICILYASNDLIIYDVGACSFHSYYYGAQLLRNVQGRLRTFSVSGSTLGSGFRAEPALALIGAGKAEVPSSRTFQGYDRLADGVRIRWQAGFAAGKVQVAETWRIGGDRGRRQLLREVSFTGVPTGRSVRVSREPENLGMKVQGPVDEATGSPKNDLFHAGLVPNHQRAAGATFRVELTLQEAPPPADRIVLPDSGKIEGSLQRPGYRAIAYPRPKTVAGDDRIMPAALAVNPKDGRVFVASLKTGELFVLRDPTGDGKAARFDNYAHGLFQEALSMLAEPDALYVLHRRNLTRIVETKRDGVADRFDRVAALPQGVADSYDYGYGLVRDRIGAFVFTHAPYANTQMPGSGSALRLVPGKKPQEIAFGFRNPLGWCAGPGGEIFFTDNQGEWVATNKLCHLVEGRFYGFPNSAQRQHASKPPGRTAVWIPYGWARSINGVAYDNTGGNFGPFAGQFFLAELMFGGAIIRASLEEVNGAYQGACVPFWGAGLLGPLTLAFDPKGHLFVGGITEPGWMAQPDRGALFRIDYTGSAPFEMQSIHILPRGFRILFTKPVDARTARDRASYQLEHYRYEYTGAYGSPEYDRTHVIIERVELSADGRSVEVLTGPPVKNRVYLIRAPGARSTSGESLVHPTAAYTVNEVPEH
ncbi:MAG TPA: hypothetical protein VK395_18860 [Gemmataceae bacterium]|nr:hypothetical protein [Gemmataceae bacterium]